MYEAAVSVPSCSVRLLEKAIVEPQNRSARSPCNVPRVLSFTENASSSTKKSIRLTCKKSFSIA
jgi:hypothetical protein